MPSIPDILKLAQMQTLVDAVNLLAYLRTEVGADDHQKIDDMIHRLTNMGHSIANA